MSKQEPSYFEADQPIDQPQNQLVASSQKDEDAKTLQPESSADNAQKETPIEAQEVPMMAEVASEDNWQQWAHELPISNAPVRRYPSQSPHELRHILMIIFAVAVLTALAFTACMGYLGFKRPTETYFFAEKAHQKIIINNDQGSITVHCQSHGPFGFHVERYSKGFGPGLLGMDVYYTQYAAITTLTAHVPPDILFSGTRGINIDVTVPVADVLQLHTGEGPIVIWGITGKLVAAAGKGALMVANCRDEL